MMLTKNGKAPRRLVFPMTILKFAVFVLTFSISFIEVLIKVLTKSYETVTYNVYWH